MERHVIQASLGKVHQTFKCNQLLCGKLVKSRHHLKHCIKSPLLVHNRLCGTVQEEIRKIHTSTRVSTNGLPTIIQTTKQLTHSDEKIKKISKAMRAYLERAQAHDTFMKQQTEEYEMGKRHLANMMGVDANHMSQQDIDEAISYLMPSGLFEKKARPLMKHPEEIFSKRKAAEFDITGRPFHFLFYTGRPNYYQTLHDIALKYEELDSFEDRMIRQGISEPPEEMKLILTGSQWLKVEELNDKFLEVVSESRYEYFVISMTRLADHLYSYRFKDFILNFRKPLGIGLKEIVIPPLLTNDVGRQYSTARGVRKLAKYNVTVLANGTGNVDINGHDIKYFESVQDREQLLFPLQFTGLLNKVDVQAELIEGDFSNQAGAIRHGLSWALLTFVEKEMVEKMRLAGLLTKDPRYRERKKPGQKGARAKYTWKKR